MTIPLVASRTQGWRCNVHVTYDITISTTSGTPFRTWVAGFSTGDMTIQAALIGILNAQATLSWNNAMMQVFIFHSMQRAVNVTYNTWNGQGMPVTGGEELLGSGTSRQITMHIMVASMVVQMQEQDERSPVEIDKPKRNHHVGYSCKMSATGLASVKPCESEQNRIWH